MLHERLKVNSLIHMVNQICIAKIFVEPIEILQYTNYSAVTMIEV